MKAKTVERTGSRNPYGHLWGLAEKSAKLQGIPKEEYVYDIVSMTFGKSRLHELTRGQLNILIKRFSTEAAEAARAAEPLGGSKQWRYIKWLQKEIGWSNAHLCNYVRMVAKIDHEKFLTSGLAREVISGMKQTLGFNEKKGDAPRRQWVSKGKRNAAR